MYRLGGGKRRSRSAQKLLNCLFELLKNKEFQHISITELCRESGVSRNSFYRMFNETSDILVYACDSLSEQFVEMTDSVQGKRLGIFIDNYLRCLIDHCDILEAVYRCNRPDILEQSMLRVKKLKSPDVNNNPAFEYINALTCAASISVLMVWIRRGKQETPEELHRIFNKVFSFNNPPSGG